VHVCTCPALNAARPSYQLAPATPMNSHHTRSKFPPPASHDAVMTQAMKADAMLDRFLLGVWLVLALLTLSCASLVSAAP
jgi:hypothetical protein